MLRRRSIAPKLWATSIGSQGRNSKSNLHSHSLFEYFAKHKLEIIAVAAETGQPDFVPAPVYFRMLPLAQRLAERSGPSTSLCCRTLVRKRHKQNTIIALIHKHAQIQLKVDRDRVRAYHHRSRLQQAPYTYYVAHLRTSTAGRTIRIRRAYITHNRDCIARGIVRYQRARLIIVIE